MGFYECDNFIVMHELMKLGYEPFLTRENEWIYTLTPELEAVLQRFF